MVSESLKTSPFERAVIAVLKEHLQNADLTIDRLAEHADITRARLLSPRGSLVFDSYFVPHFWCQNYQCRLARAFMRAPNSERPHSQTAAEPL